MKHSMVACQGGEVYHVCCPHVPPEGQCWEIVPLGLHPWENELRPTDSVPVERLQNIYLVTLFILSVCPQGLDEGVG